MSWRRRYADNKRALIEWGPKYPFMMWVPQQHSFDPGGYERILKSAGRTINFVRLPINDDWHVWGFQDYAALSLFTEDLKRVLETRQSAIDDSETPES